MVAIPSCGQLNRENNISLSLFAREYLVSRYRFDYPVPSRVSALILHTESSIINHQSSIWCLLTGFPALSSATTVSNYIVDHHRPVLSLSGPA